MTLAVRHLTFGYTAQTTTIYDLSLSVARGEIVGLIGPNGSGKSTLLKCIADLVDLRNGKIDIDGHDHKGVQAKRAAILIAGNDDLPDFLSGREFVTLTHRMYDSAIGEDRIAALFERYAMAHRQDALIEDYSHGMRKKLQLITALSLALPLTIIDETLNGVDLDSLYRAEDDVRHLSNNGALVVCSHDFRFLEAVADRIVALHHGEIVHDSPLVHVKATFGSIDQLARHLVQEVA